MRRIHETLLTLLIFYMGIPASGYCKNEPLYQPFWTGSLLSRSGKVVDPGHYNIEPYFFDEEFYSLYDKHWNLHTAPHLTSLRSLTISYIGLVDRVDFIVDPRVHYNRSQGRSSIHLADTTLGFGYQLIKEEEKTWVPYVRLIIEETLPTGKFDNLNPNKLGTDATGTGAYGTTIGVSIQKLYILDNRHPLRMRFNAFITGFGKVRVKGFNTFGGGFGTHGAVHVGDIFEAILAAEYSLTQNWVFAIDLGYLHTGRTSFRGFPGITATGALATVGNPSSEVFSLAPAVEYNFNKHVGIIGGIWFSLAGRNVPAFINPTIAVNIVY